MVPGQITRPRANAETEDLAALTIRMRRQRRLLWLTAIVALVATGGLAATRFVQSPAKIAEQTAPPAASVITAPVSYGVMQTSAVFRGTYDSGRSLSFTPDSEVAPDGAGPQTQKLVVSGIDTRPGASVRAGQVLLSVSDRPLFVMKGAIPAFRDLVQGESGGDVGQLQAALANLGYGSWPDHYGDFGQGTADAVRAFYQAIGYPVPSAPTGHGLVEVPMSEVMFVPSLPATVTAAPSAAGAQVPTPLVSLSVGDLSLTGQLPPSAAGEVRPGMTVQVMSNVSGTRTSGIVTSVGRLVSGGAGGSPYLPLGIAPRRPWPWTWAGQNVQLTITSAATSHAVLSVPEAAVSSGADAMTFVTVETAGGQRRVRVRTGATANGMVQVTPVRGGLAAGDRVVIGG